MVEFHNHHGLCGRRAAEREFVKIAGSTHGEGEGDASYGGGSMHHMERLCIIWREPMQPYDRDASDPEQQEHVHSMGGSMHHERVNPIFSSVLSQNSKLLVIAQLHPRSTEHLMSNIHLQGV